jgi:hypothetical protein
MATNIELEKQVIALRSELAEVKSQTGANGVQALRDEFAKILSALNLFFNQAREGREWTAAKRAVGLLEEPTEPEFPLAEASSTSYEEQRKAESDHNMRLLLKSCGSSEAVIEQVLKV